MQMRTLKYPRCAHDRHGSATAETQPGERWTNSLADVSSVEATPIKRVFNVLFVCKVRVIAGD